MKEQSGDMLRRGDDFKAVVLNVLIRNRCMVTSSEGDASEGDACGESFLSGVSVGNSQR